MPRFFAVRGQRLSVTRVDAVASTTVRFTVLAVAVDATRMSGFVPVSPSVEELTVDVTTDNDRTVDTFVSAEIFQSRVVEIVGLSATILSSGAVKRGQLYCRVSLGGATTTEKSVLIASGYVYDGTGLGLGVFVEPGATAIYNESVTVTNQATAGAADILCIYAAASGNSLELLNGRMANTDTVIRNSLVFTSDGAIILSFIKRNQNIAAGSWRSVPVPNGSGPADSDEVGAPGRVILNGTMQLRFDFESVADGEDATFIVSFLVRGMLPAAPVRTTAGAGTETTTVNFSELTFLDKEA